jgi:hypothetical protein
MSKFVEPVVFWKKGVIIGLAVLSNWLLLAVVELNCVNRFSNDIIYISVAY